MSIAELYETFYAILEAMDRTFEFWLTGTFAIIIATYFIGKTMRFTMFVLLIVGYVLFSFGLAVRYITSGTKLLEIREHLIAAGETYDLVLSDLSGDSVFVTFLFGVVGTLIYLVQTYRGKGAT